MFTHGITFGGHPVQAAIALKNIEIMRRERSSTACGRTSRPFRATLEQLLELPIVGDLRGAGYFWAIELVADKETRATFTAEECEWLLRGFLSQRMFDAGLICRADDRGDPVDPALPAADRRPAGVRPDRRDPRRGAGRGPGADAGHGRHGLLAARALSRNPGKVNMQPAQSNDVVRAIASR